MKKKEILEKLENCIINIDTINTLKDTSFGCEENDGKPDFFDYEIDEAVKEAFEYLEELKKPTFFDKIIALFETIFNGKDVVQKINCVQGDNVNITQIAGKNN